VRPFGDIVEDERKTIRAALETTGAEALSLEAIREALAQAWAVGEVTAKGGDRDTPAPEAGHNEATPGDKVELEILPPRDQEEIVAINAYLVDMPEVMKVKLNTMVDRSVFEVALYGKVNLVERLISLPQVGNAEEVIVNGQKRIRVTLLAKTKLERNRTEMNDKVNELLTKKKR
jgi:hypothetical protein